MKQKTITVVGAGTAGSLASAHLKKHFPNYKVRLLYSETVGTIGVGESVTPPIVHFMKDLGADEIKWMHDTGSIFKYANCFEDWTGEKDKHYFAFSYNEPVENFLNGKHSSFEDIKTVKNTDIRLTDIWLDLFRRGTVKNFSESFNPLHYYMDKLVAPYVDQKYQGANTFSYAYHIDAEKLGPWVRENIGKPLGVEEIIGTIKSVNKDKNSIQSVLLDNGSLIKSDIWIDATGFHQRLIKELEPQYKEYTHCPANSAWVGPISYSDKTEEMKNYTQSIRQYCGWQFKIGLQDRMGTGLVYSDKYFSDKETKEHFLKLQNGRGLKEPRLIKWKPQRLIYPAQGNVITIGMGAGFVEPMEANALFITVATIWQCHLLLDKTITNREYNQYVGTAVDDIADFLSVHYTLCPKNSENLFWRDMYQMGIELNHKELLLEKYNSVQNTFASSSKFFTIFPDYMWAELASAWTPSDLKNWYKTIPHDLALKYYYKLEEQKKTHYTNSKKCQKYATWIDQNV